MDSSYAVLACGWSVHVLGTELKQWQRSTACHCYLRDKPGPILLFASVDGGDMFLLNVA